MLNLHLVLNQALGQAVRWQLLPSNPAKGTQPPRPKRSERLVVDPDLTKRLLEATAGTSYELPCALALATGMRRGEILALRWNDVGRDYSSLQVVRTLQPSQHGLVYEQPKTRSSYVRPAAMSITARLAGSALALALMPPRLVHLPLRLSNLA